MYTPHFEVYYPQFEVYNPHIKVYNPHFVVYNLKKSKNMLHLYASGNIW